MIVLVRTRAAGRSGLNLIRLVPYAKCCISSRSARLSAILVSTSASCESSVSAEECLAAPQPHRSEADSTKRLLSGWRHHNKSKTRHPQRVLILHQPDNHRSALAPLPPCPKYSITALRSAERARRIEVNTHVVVASVRRVFGNISCFDLRYRWRRPRHERDAFCWCCKQTVSASLCAARADLFLPENQRHQRVSRTTTMLSKEIHHRRAEAKETSACFQPFTFFAKVSTQCSQQRPPFRKTLLQQFPACGLGLAYW